MKQNKPLSNVFAYIMVFASILLLSVSGVYAVQSSVDLGTASDFVILAKSGISTTGTTSIVGNIGVSPIAATAITGLGLIMDSSNTFSTSSLVTGKVYAADYALSTPSRMTTAISNMETAYIDAAGRTLPDATELGAGDISGMTLAPGLYKWGTGVLIDNRGVTLSGSSTDVWIFQIAQDLTVANGAIITLSGGAQAKNVFWQVAGQTTLGTTSDFQGIVLCKTAIILNTGAKLNGRALAQTAVTLDSNNVFLLYENITLPQTLCGDGIITSDEECDSGNDNGIACMPSNRKDCTYCNSVCDNVVVKHSHPPNLPPTDPPEGVPEFTPFGIGLAVIGATLGIVFLRKR